jgi:hypothetical protein
MHRSKSCSFKYLVGVEQNRWWYDDVKRRCGLESQHKFTAMTPCFRRSHAATRAIKEILDRPVCQIFDLLFRKTDGQADLIHGWEPSL